MSFYMQNWFVKETCMQLLEDRKVSRTHGVRKPQLYTFRTKQTKPHKKNPTATITPNIPSCHSAQTLWMLKKKKKCHFWQKSMQAII